ncbi:MAG: hypothetical protein RML45_01890 [Acetobacteraceae bacterium]|nr:hypothetical protein [Acetobacteraceae bacterium]
METLAIGLSLVFLPASGKLLYLRIYEGFADGKVFAAPADPAILGEDPALCLDPAQQSGKGTQQAGARNRLG